MTPRRAKNIVAVTPGGPITDEQILGYITLYRVPDEPVSASKVYRLWVGEGLPHELIPRTRQAVHAFQVACRSVATRRRNGDAASRRQEIEVDPVHETPDRCVYQVTTLVRDTKNEVIEHPKTMRVIFDKRTEAIHWEPLDRLFDTDQVSELGAAIRDHFDANSKKLSGHRVREGIRKLMDHLDATNLRRKGGGVYLVPREGKRDLDSLGRILDQLWPGNAEVNTIPCANDEGAREMVERHFDVNVSVEIDEIMARVTDALKGRSGRQMRQDAIGNILARRKQLGERRERYADLLDTEMGEVGTKLELLDQQLEALVLSKAEDE